MKKDRATIFVLDAGKSPSAEYRWVVDWLTKWKDAVTVSGYSTGGWEHLWDVEGPTEAMSEIPEEYHCHSVWVERGKMGWKAQTSNLNLKFKLPPRRQ